jgi:hypothetical protein
MEKKLASRIIDIIITAERNRFHALNEFVERLTDPQDRSIFCGMVAQMSFRHMDIIMPLIGQYPDLDPDK